MRILHIEDEIWDSGIAHYAMTLALEMQRLGHSVWFWGTEGSFLSQQARAAGLPVTEIKNPWISLHTLRGFLKKNKIDVINAHTGSGHSLAAAAAAGLKIPVIRTRGDVRMPAKNALARALSHRTALYIAANSRIKENLLETYPQARVEVVFQGIEAPPPPALPADPIVGILGRLDPVKGHEDFIVAAKEALRTYPHIRFLAAGGGSEERLAKLKAWAARLGLENKVEFLGFVSDAREFISRCRIAVVASVESEAVSRATLEWMSCGRPIIATRVGCLTDLIEDEVSGVLVPAGHPGQIALAIKNFLKVPSDAERMGAAARARFESLFSLDRFVKTTLSHYEDVLRPVPSRR